MSEINYTSYTILFLYYYIDIQGFKDPQLHANKDGIHLDSHIYIFYEDDRMVGILNCSTYTTFFKWPSLNILRLKQ